jgi:hypothetical protein
LLRLLPTGPQPLSSSVPLPQQWSLYLLPPQGQGALREGLLRGMVRLSPGATFFRHANRRLVACGPRRHPILDGHVEEQTVALLSAPAGRRRTGRGQSETGEVERAGPPTGEPRPGAQAKAGTVSGSTPASALPRDHQKSEMVWPHSGQVCRRSPSRHGFKTAVHFGHRSGGVLLGTAGSTGSSAWTQILLAFGSCHRRA